MRGMASTVWHVDTMRPPRIRSQVVTARGCKASCGSYLRKQTLIYDIGVFDLMLSSCRFFKNPRLMNDSDLRLHLPFHYKQMSLLDSGTKADVPFGC